MNIIVENRDREKIKQILKFGRNYNRKFEEKLDESLNIINEWSKDKSVVLWSGGRDSTILLHLVLRVNSDVHVLFVDTGVEHSETLEFISFIVKTWGISNFHIVHPEYSSWNLPNYSPHNFFKCTYWLKIHPSRKFLKEQEIHVQFLGDRGDERLSRIFKLNNGLVQNDKLFEDFDVVDVYPIGYWSDDDINLYALKNNITFNKLYMMGYERTGCFFCPFDLKPLKEKHPEIYQYLMNITKSKNTEELMRYLEMYLLY